MRPKIKRKSKYGVYIVECKNGTYYTGYTNNLENRIKLHNKGYGAKYLRGKGPVKLVYWKKFKTQKAAMCEEIRIKELRKEQKVKLIEESDS
jgi:putative endonuclease